MSSPAGEDQDQRNNAGLEDLTTMTIESLRARLLSERAISKSTSQRADDLAKRVAELEEQLRIVSLQRKKAEKATADVLAILESNGISDASEGYNSSSDQETSISDSKVSNDSARRKETSTNFEARRNDMETYSSSEIDSSPSTARSLSWRSSKGSSNSLERKKYIDSTRRRCSSFTSNGSLPKRVGKSCRRIRRKENRASAEELQNDDNIRDDTVATCSQDLPSSSGIGPSGTMRKEPESHEVDLLEASVTEVPKKGVVEANFSSGNERGEEVERHFRDETQSMAQYEAEEKAQREWEEKFRENNIVLDSCDPGNRSDVTEERDEIKAPDESCAAGRINSLNQDTELEVVKASFTKELKAEVPNNLVDPLHFRIGHIQDQKIASMVAHESPSSEFAFPMSKGFHGQMCSFSCKNIGESSGSTKELALMPQNSSSKLDSVLDALQQAKLSLKHKIYSMPPLEDGSSGKGFEPSIPAGKIGDRMEIPVGCPPGLFRLPTDLQFEKTASINYRCSDSALGLPNYYPESACDKSLTGPFVEPRPTAFAGDPFCSHSNIGYTEMQPGNYQCLDSALGLPNYYPESARDKSLTSPFVEPRQTAFAGDPFSSHSNMDYTKMQSGSHVYTPHFVEGGSRIHTAATPTEMRSGIHTYTSHFTERGSGSEQISATPFTEFRTGIPFTEIRSGVSTRKPIFEPTLDAGVSSTGRSNFLDPHVTAGIPFSTKYTYPTYPFSPDMTPQLPSSDRFSRNVPSMEFGMPSAARSSFYDNHIGPNMYK